MLPEPESGCRVAVAEAEVARNVEMRRLKEGDLGCSPAPPEATPPSLRPDQSTPSLGGHAPPRHALLRARTFLQVGLGQMV